MDYAAILSEKLAVFGLKPEIIDKYAAFMDMLFECNKLFNLTAITSAEDAAVKHFADSLYGEKAIPRGSNVIDIGSGGGFPGLVLALARPDIKVTLLDSNAKKTGFLNKAVAALDVRNAAALTGRAEEIGRSARRESYDAATARAVSPLNELLEYALPLIKPGGRLIAYKGSGADTEIESAAGAFSALHAGVLSVDRFTLDGKYERAVITIVKNKKTPAEYPRENKKIKSHPL